MSDSVQSVLGRVLKYGLALTILVAAFGSLIGYFVAGINGVWAGLTGSALAFIFSGLTALSVYYGAKFNPGVMMAMVLGGWVVKMVIFLIVFGALKHVDWFDRAAGPVLFFSLVATVLGGLLLDIWLVTKARFRPETKLP
jgi:hypothetical protein